MDYIFNVPETDHKQSLVVQGYVSQYTHCCALYVRYTAVPLLYERVYITKHETYAGRRFDHCDGAAVTTYDLFLTRL